MNSLQNLSSTDFQRIRLDLIKAGIPCLLVSLIMLILITYGIYKYGELNSIALIFGGLMGVSLPFIAIGRPERVGSRSQIPKKLSKYEQKLKSIIFQFRNMWIIVLSTIPYFACLLYLISSGYTLQYSSITDFIFTSFLSLLFVGFFVTGIQLLQVRWSIDKSSSQ